jgi:hypothetical protein
MEVLYRFITQSIAYCSCLLYTSNIRKIESLSLETCIHFCLLPLCLLHTYYPLAQFYSYPAFMDKIKNGDPVIYKDQQGIIYGKPRESKYKGTLYTVKVGDDYFKATPNELTVKRNQEDQEK